MEEKKSSASNDLLKMIFEIFFALIQICKSSKETNLVVEGKFKLFFYPFTSQSLEEQFIENYKQKKKEDQGKRRKRALEFDSERTTVLKLPNLKLPHSNIKTWSSLSKEGFYILIDQCNNRISLPFCLFTKVQKRCRHFYSCSDRLENFIKGKDLRGKSLSEILRVYKEAWETIHLKGYCSCEGDLKKTFTKVLEDFKFLRTHKSVVNENNQGLEKLLNELEKSDLGFIYKFDPDIHKKIQEEIHSLKTPQTNRVESNPQINQEIKDILYRIPSFLNQVKGFLTEKPTTERVKKKKEELPMQKDEKGEIASCILLTNSGLKLQLSDNYEEAEKCLTKAYNIRKEKLGIDAPETVQSVHQLELLQKMKKEHKTMEENAFISSFLNMEQINASVKRSLEENSECLDTDTPFESDQNTKRQRENPANSE